MRSAISWTPNLIVFSLLMGVLYTGHHHAWKIPKWSQLFSKRTISNVDWCSDHLVAASECIECNLGLLPKDKPKGFCWEHGVSECVIHHPSLAQVSEVAAMSQYDTVPAIQLMHRLENSSRDELPLKRVQFASAATIEKTGIVVAIVQEHPIVEAITAPGHTSFDPTRVAHLSSRAAGTVAVVFKAIGDRVSAGESLALVDAATVGQAKSHLLQAIVQWQLSRSTMDRLKPVAASGAVPMRSLIEAEARVKEAEIEWIGARQALTNLGFTIPPDFDYLDSEVLSERLRYLGLTADMIQAIPKDSKTTNLIPILAPHDGVIIDAEVVAGEVVSLTDQLFTVADPSRMWLMISVRQENATLVALGMRAEFSADEGKQSKSSVVAAGNVDWISPTIDQATRTLKVRVLIDNTDGKLKDNGFGNARIILRQEPFAITVPRESVQSTRDGNYVFVRDKRFFEAGSPKFFHVRQVRIGAGDETNIELLAGVLPGEIVASKGSPILMAQLLRSSLGAGCTCCQ